jgi:hypothetical protein
MAEPDAPFVMETICVGGHGIASGYRACAGGRAGRARAPLAATMRHERGASAIQAGAEGVLRSARF